MVTLNEAYAKLSTLSEARARHVVELIDYLAELEAREEAEDLVGARQALAEIAAGETPLDWEEVKRDLDVLHRSNQ